MLIENASVTGEPSYEIVATGFETISGCATYLQSYHNGLLDASGLEESHFIGKYIIAKSIGDEFEVTGRMG